MSSDSANSSPPAPDNQYREAITLYRESVKWVISSFGAVAAALIVGIQLTSLGELHGERLTWALISIGVVFASIIGIIVAAVRVLSPISGTYAAFKDDRGFKPLRDFLEKDNTPLRGKAKDAGELADKYEKTLQVENEKWHLYNADQGNASARDEYLEAKKYRVSLFQVVRAVTTLGLFLRTKQLFGRAMRVVYFGVALGAIGAIAFAYLANPPATTAKKSSTANVVVSARLPLNCAGFYLTLDRLAQNEPNVGKRWPAGSVGPQAKACGFQTKQELTKFVSKLTRR